MPIFTPDVTVSPENFDKNGTLVGSRSMLNLIEGSNTGLTVADNAAQNRVDVTFNSSSTTFLSVLLSLSPVSVWNLDETSGTLASDVNSLVNGTYGAGTVLNQAALPSSGSSHSASFPSATSYVDLGTASYGFPGLSAFTWLAWVNVTALQGSDQAIVSRLFDNASGRQSYRLAVFGDSIGGSTFEFSFDRYLNGTILSASDSVGARSTGTRYMVTGIYDGANLKLYVNNSLIQTTADSRSLVSASASLWLGNRSISTGHYLNGLGDAYAVWSRALSASEVSSLYSAGL